MTQCLLVLFAAAPSPRAVRDAVGKLGAPTPDGVQVDDLAVTVDVSAARWPDDPDDAALAATFAAGAFGPHARPQSLQNAVDHPWTWKESRMVGPRHQAFVRLSVARAGRHAVELLTLTRLAGAILALPGALCLFAPAGEALRPADAVVGGLRRIGALPAPVDLWTNTRLASLGPVWQVLDTIGMAQLDLPDLEALFSQQATTWRAVDAFLRNLQLYLVDRGELADGDHLPGPDGTDWEVRAPDRSLMEPQRRVLQLAPAGGVDLPVVRV